MCTSCGRCLTITHTVTGTGTGTGTCTNTLDSNRAYSLAERGPSFLYLCNFQYIIFFSLDGLVWFLFSFSLVFFYFSFRWATAAYKIPISQCTYSAHSHINGREETELNSQPIIELTNVNIKHRRHPYEYYSVLCCYFSLVFFDSSFVMLYIFHYGSVTFLLIYVRISLESDVFFFFCSVFASNIFCMHRYTACRNRVYFRLFVCDVRWCPFSRYATPFFSKIHLPIFNEFTVIELCC